MIFNGEGTGPTWLKLLVDNASTVMLEKHREQFLDNLAEPQERLEVELEFARAIQLKAQLEERQRRVRELSALFKIAGRLTQIRDVDELLREVVGQAHALLDVETAFLGTIDDDGDMTIRCEVGTLTNMFEGARVPANSGVGSLVISTRRPYWTSDYMADDSFLHNEHSDGRISREGISSVLGVPLILRDQVMGVLFVAHRQSRPFTEHDCSLLLALASHAVIALENARLFEDARQAMKALNLSNERIRVQNSRIQREVDLHERLVETVVAGGGIPEIIEVVADVMHGSAEFVYAPNGYLDPPTCAGDQILTASDTLDPKAVAQRFMSRESRRVHQISTHRGLVTLVPVTARLEYLGALALYTDHPLEPADQRLLERAGLVAAMVLMSERALAEAEMRMQGEFLSELLSHPERDRSVVERRARQAGIDLNEQASILVALPAEGHEKDVNAWIRRVTAGDGGVFGEHAGYVVVLLPNVEADAVAGRLRNSLEATSRIATVGVADPGTGPSALLTAFSEARQLIRALIALGRQGEIASVGDLGVYRFLFAQAQHDDLKRFVRAMIGPLLDVDKSRNSDLARTLEVLLAHGRRPGPAAAELHIHVNTLYQRMDRITKAIGSKWKDPNQTLEYQIALRVHRLLECGSR